MTEKRAMFVVPRGSKEGFLLLERRASAHLKNHLEDTVFRACNSLFGISVDVTAFVDLEAWNNFLDNGEGVEVKSVWRPTTLEGTFTGANLEDEGELQTVVTGAVASRVFRRVKGDIVRALLGEDTTADAVEVATPSELIPRDIDNFERSKLALTAILDNEKRTVLVERGAPPQFYYPLGGRPETPVLRDLWVAETEKVARIYGASLPEGWDKGAWTRQQLQVGLRRPS